MAAYGRGQMLGTGIDPRLMTMDYSPFVDAAATQARGIASLGANIGGAIAKVGDYKKQQAEDERLVQKSKSVAKAIGDLIPDLQPTIQESMMILDDKELPLSRRKAEAEAISDILNLGINEVSNRQEVALKQRELGLQEAANIARYSEAENEILQKAMKRTPKEFSVGGLDIVVQEDGFGNIYDPKSGDKIIDLQNYIIGGNEWSGGISGSEVGLEEGDAAKSIEEASVLLGGNYPDGVRVDGTPLVTPAPTSDGEPKVKPTVTTPRGIRSSQLSGAKFRPATPEEAARYGAVTGQIDESTGRFYPAPQSQDTLSEKRKLFEKARESYRSGNDDEALSILFSLGAKNFLGESYTAADLPDIFGEKNKKEEGGIENKKEAGGIGEILGE